MEEIIILTVSVISGIATYIVSNILNRGPVIASAIITLVAGLMFPYFYPLMGDVLAAAAACASYAGMISVENALNLLEMAVISFFVRENDNFKRISTNIMSDENERAVDTYLGTDHNAYETVMKGESYIGEAEILGENYYTAYRPLKDVNNNIIGLLFVGTPTRILDSIITGHDTTMSKINVLVIVLRAISLGSLIILASASVGQSRERRMVLETSPREFTRVLGELTSIH